MVNSTKKTANYQNLYSTTKKAIKNAVWFLGYNAFLFLLIFILLEILFGEYLFYKYVFLAKMQEDEAIVSITFKENTYRSVLEEWKKRDAIFEHASENHYPDPFQ